MKQGIFLFILIFFSAHIGSAQKTGRVHPNCKEFISPAKVGFNTQYQGATSQYKIAIKLYREYRNHLPTEAQAVGERFNEARNRFAVHSRWVERYGKSVSVSLCVSNTTKTTVIRNLKNLRRMDLHLRSLDVDSENRTHYFQNYR